MTTQKCVPPEYPHFVFRHIATSKWLRWIVLIGQVKNSICHNLSNTVHRKQKNASLPLFLI